MKVSLPARVLVLLLWSLPLGNSLPAQTPDSEIQGLAHDLAATIGRKLPFARNPKAKITYVVFDFREVGGKPSQLGVRLADEFSEAMRNQLPGFKPVERAKLRQFCEQEHFDSASFEMDALGLWAATGVGANQVILGTIEPQGHAFLLHVRAVSSQEKEIANATQRLEGTEQRNAWRSQSASLLPPDGPWKDVPSALKEGYSEPHCIHCPLPPYTNEARKARIEGTITLILLVEEDGFVHGVVIKRGMPFGLNKSSVESVKKWKFDPARGPDGKAAAVQFDVEINFRLL